jgi:purine-binding chemotaxis protein CheW
LTAAGTPVAAPDPVTASAAEEPPAAELADTDELLAALEAELAERSTAREAGLMPAFEGPIEVVENAVIEANIILEETRDLMGVGSANGTSGTNGHATTNGAAAVSNLVTPTAPPPTPTTEGPVRSTVAAQPPTTPTAAPKPQPAERVRPAEEQMVVLDVGDESYGIPVKQVREIIRVPPITRVPNGPSFLEGVINLRGQVIPVMDLRKHLGIVGGSETRRSRVVVSELGRHTVGLMVDAVSEVVMVSAADIEPPPAIIAGANDGQICGVVRLGDRLVLFLDPERMLPNR